MPSPIPPYASLGARPPEPPAERRPHTLTGDVRTHENFASRHLEQQRHVMVYLPPGYDAGGVRRYPVLYLHDGQNVFDRATAFGEEWQVDESAQALIMSGAISPLIIVAVYNAGAHRVDEYTPTELPDNGGGGHADDYGRMLVEELKPFIDAGYLTLPSAASTAVGGSSLGGLLSMHLGIRYPTVFGRLAVLSPSIWWDDRIIVRSVEALPRKLPTRIWLDVGTREGAAASTNARALRDALVSRGWTVGEDLMYEEVEGGEHNEQSWGARIGRVLQYLFPKH
ncbi:MAG: alpha/beta hydrolase [Gemmatimonadaceae bacterium]|nr:alpha/beta hydrolase [Gemmatimonadaceae bacterium]